MKLHNFIFLFGFLFALDTLGTASATYCNGRHYDNDDCTSTCCRTTGSNKCCSSLDICCKSKYIGSSLTYCCDDGITSLTTYKVSSAVGLGVGIIVAVVLSIVGVIVAICVVICCCCCRQRPQRVIYNQPQTTSPVTVVNSSQHTMSAMQQPYPAPGQYQQPAQYPPPGQQYPQPGQQYPPADKQYEQPGTHYPPSGQQYPPPSQQYPNPGQQYPNPGQEPVGAFHPPTMHPEQPPAYS